MIPQNPTEFCGHRKFIISIMRHTVKKSTKATREKHADQGKVKFVPAQLILDLLKQFLRV
jgi:hypothetical protein